MSCAFPGCLEPANKTCSRCLKTKYCSAEHQKSHWKWHKKICVAPEKKKISAPVPTVPAVPMRGKEEEEEEKEEGNLYVACLNSVANAKLRPCGHSATCRECTVELRKRGEPCALCRKPISGFTVGKWQSMIGEHGMWPTSLKNLSELASGEGFTSTSEINSAETRRRT